MSDLIVRIEPVQRAEDLRPGLAARLLDPLWLLGRQWLLGEFDGEDAGTPVSVEYEIAHYPPETLYGPGGKSPLVDGAPLESRIEAVADPDGGWDLRKRIETAALLARMLCDEGLDDLLRTLFEEFPLKIEGAPQTALSEAGLPLAPGAVADGEALYLAVVEGRLTWHFRYPAVKPVIDTWLTLVAETLPGPLDTWEPERLSYRAELRCAGLQPALRIPEHRGGGLGWMSADLDAPVSGAAPTVRTERRTPTALRFRGMPQSRYWECEDAGIDLGAVDAPAAELGRAAMVQFSMLYGNDAFIAPVRIPGPGLCGLRALRVADSFGDVVGETALNAATRAGAAPGHGWALWSPVAGAAPQPWIFLPPPLVAPLIGDPIEEAVLARDEMANRAWAVVKTVTGADGRRSDVAPHPPEPEPPSTTADYRYRLATDAPAGWIPLVQISEPAGRRLRRDDPSPMLSRSLPPGARVHDEEVGREGVRLRVEYVMARGSDGGTASWVRIRRSAGRGGVASGLRHDVATPVAG